MDIYFKPYFQIADDCKIINQCVGSKKYLYINGTPHISYNGQNNYKHLVLSDGTLLIFHVDPKVSECSDGKSPCASIFVDTNGYFKGPNQFGKDFFVISLYKDKVAPYGVGSTSWVNACARRESYGLGCALWVLTYENLDYLHCDGLSWNGKTSCK